MQIKLLFLTTTTKEISSLKEQHKKDNEKNLRIQDWFLTRDEPDTYLHFLRFEIFYYFHSLGPVHGGWEE